ncbi:reverse transcriptase domain-containing protein [Tanacetum coccineum]
MAEEQPLPAATSPTAQSPDYVLESGPKEESEDDDDEDPEEDPVDYPADGGDDGDDEDEPSDDDEDEEVDIKADDKEEEEHPAHADSITVALLAADQALSTDETESFETDESVATPPPHPVYRVTARISIPDPVPTLVWSDAKIPFPPLPPIPSLSIPLSPPLPISAPPPASPIRPLGYRAAMIRLRAEAASTSHSLPLPPLSPIPAPTPSPPLLLPSTNRREDRPEVTLPPRKRLGIALGPRYEVGESSSAAAARPAGGLRADYGFVATMDREIRHDLERDVGYGITDSWDEIVEAMQGTPVVTDVAEFSQRMTEFETRVRQDTDEIYTRDRHAYARTARLMKTKARMSREAWGRSMDASDLAHAEETDGDYRDAGERSQETEAVHRGTESDKETTYSDGRAMIDQGVTTILAARDANTNGVDSHNSGTGARRNERATREYTYLDFMKCQPLNFKGTEGVVELTQWIERMETMFRICNCSVENQIKFSTCTLLGNALTWWNSHVRTIGNDIAYAMTWTELKKKMTYKYCPRTEIKKLKVELWELKVKGSDVIGYNQHFQELALLVMSSPNHPTSGIEDAFSSNFLDYIPASPDYVLASPGKTYSSSSNNSFEFFLFEEILPLKKRGRDRSSSSTSVLPQEFEIGENSRKTSLERHEEQIEEIRNHLDELSLDRIEHIEDNIEVGIPPKRTSTSEAPAMTQAAIKKLVAESVSAALEAQAANMANTDNTTRPREAHVARQCSYKEFMRCQPINFKGLEGVVGLICWFERTESVFSRSNCTEDCKVKFATGTLTEEALSWWNSFTQPIRIEEAYKITWVEFKKLLIKKYCPRTEVQKTKDEFYHLTVKGNDLKTYVRRFQELATLCPTMVPDSEKMIEVFIGGLPRSIEGNVTASKPKTLEEAINIA